MEFEEAQKKWKSFLKQLESVHRFLFMYLKAVQFKALEGDSIIVSIEESRYEEIEDGLTQYAASLARYLPSHFGAGAHLVVSVFNPNPSAEPEAPPPASPEPTPPTAPSIEAAPPIVQEEKEDPEKLFRAGLGLAQSGDLMAAKERLLRAAELFGMAGIWEQKIKALQEYLKFEENADVRAGLAEAFNLAGQNEAAGQEYLRLASGFFEKGDIGKVELLAEKAVSAGQAEGLIFVAQAAIQRKDFDGAAKHLGILLKTKPRHSEALRLLLNIKQFQGEAEETMNVALRLCQADPAEPSGYEALAHYFYKKDNSSKARHMLLQAAEAHFNRSQLDAAKIILHRVLEEEPANPVALRMAGRLGLSSSLGPEQISAPVAAETAGHEAAAQEAAKEAAKRNSLEDLLAFAEAEINEGTKRIDNAIAAYRRALKMDPHNAAVKAKLNSLYHWMSLEH